MSKNIDEKDIETIESNIEIRKRIVNNLYKSDDDLKDEKRVYLILKTLDSIDNTIIQKTKVKIEDDNSKNESAIKEAMLAAIVQLHKNQTNTRAGTVEDKIIDNSINMQISEDEKSLYYDETTIKDFMEKNF